MSSAYQNLGKYEKSVEVAKRAIEINPKLSFSRLSILPGPIYSWNVYGDAESTVSGGLPNANSRVLTFSSCPYVLAFYKG